jgi:hypothetical protein
MFPPNFAMAVPYLIASKRPCPITAIEAFCELPSCVSDYPLLVPAA